MRNKAERTSFLNIAIITKLLTHFFIRLLHLVSGKTISYTKNQQLSVHWATYQMTQLIIRQKFSTPVRRDEVEGDWDIRGFNCHSFSDPPGKEWNDFIHQTNELLTVVVGQLELTIENKTILVQPGDEVFILKGAIHSVKNCNNNHTNWLFGYD